MKTDAERRLDAVLEDAVGLVDKYFLEHSESLLEREYLEFHLGRTMSGRIEPVLLASLRVVSIEGGR